MQRGYDAVRVAIVQAGRRVAGAFQRHYSQRPVIEMAPLSFVVSSPNGASEGDHAAVALRLAGLLGRDGHTVTTMALGSGAVQVNVEPAGHPGAARRGTGAARATAPARRWRTQLLWYAVIVGGLVLTSQGPVQEVAAGMERRITTCLDRHDGNLGAMASCVMGSAEAAPDAPQ